jgi:hypothetical protein
MPRSVAADRNGICGAAARKTSSKAECTRASSKITWQSCPHLRLRPSSSASLLSSTLPSGCCSSFLKVPSSPRGSPVGPGEAWKAAVARSSNDRYSPSSRFCSAGRKAPYRSCGRSLSCRSSIGLHHFSSVYAFFIRGESRLGAGVEQERNYRGIFKIGEAGFFPGGKA